MIGARRPCEAGHVVVVSRYHAEVGALALFLPRYRIAHVKQPGSALKICRVAAGAAVLYPRLGQTMEWDTAGPQAVLEAAGGILTTLACATLHYGKPWRSAARSRQNFRTRLATACPTTIGPCLRSSAGPAPRRRAGWRKAALDRRAAGFLKEQIKAWADVCRRCCRGARLGSWPARPTDTCAAATATCTF